MLTIAPQMRILAAVERVDFRKGIDGLGGVCRQKLNEDPISGTMFVFLNRRRTAIKALVYDGQGFWLCQKRLSHGRFKWWPKPFDTLPASSKTTPRHGMAGQPGQIHRQLDARELQMIIWNGDPTVARMAPMWRQLAGGKPAS